MFTYSLSALSPNSVNYKIYHNANAHNKYPTKIIKYKFCFNQVLSKVVLSQRSFCNLYSLTYRRTYLLYKIKNKNHKYYESKCNYKQKQKLNYKQEWHSLNFSIRNIKYIFNGKHSKKENMNAGD